MCAVHSYRCRRKQVSCAACGLPYALGFRCFWVSPDCAIFWYISQKGLKTGQKQPKIAVFRGDNPLRIAYLTATRPLVRNLRNMARIFGDFKILLYLCSISEGNDGMLMFLIRETEAVSIALFGLLLLARAIKFVFCDSISSAFLFVYSGCACWI